MEMNFSISLCMGSIHLILGLFKAWQGIEDKGRENEEMEMQKQRVSHSHGWWFESHNSPRSSPWLQSTLAELVEKTKAMLALIEPDADSFAERAEMYYKKRPELMSMVEDFYRAHRSLAERFDQIRHDHGPRTFSIQKGQSPKASHPCKFHGRYTQEAYYSESSNESEVESEVDNPEQEDPEPVTPINIGKERLSAEVGCDEMLWFMQEINTLREENKIQKDQLIQKERRLEELMWQLSRTNDDLARLGEEVEKERGMEEQEINKLREENKVQKDQLMQKERGMEELMRQLSGTNGDLLRLGKECEKEREMEEQEVNTLREENKIQKGQPTQKGRGTRELMWQLSRTNDEMMRLSEDSEKLEEVRTEEMMISRAEMQRERLDNIAWNDPLMHKDQGKTEIALELSELREEFKVLKEDKDTQNELLMQKDEEKREAIRQLSIAMEILREENVLLKKCIALETKKKRSSFQVSKFKGLAKFFSSTPWPQTSRVPL